MKNFEEQIKILEETLSKMIEGDRVTITLENLTKDDLDYIIYKINSQ